MNFERTQLLRALKPVVVQEHLRSRGWSLEEDHSADVGFVIYARSGVAVDLPIDQAFRDYPRRLEELVATVAAADLVSVDDLLDDLSQPVGDVLAVRVDSEATSTGTLLLDDALRLRDGTRGILLAAAHSTIAPEPWFPRLSRQDAVDLLSKVREGQTQRGSFTARFVVPVEPLLGVLPGFDESFGRRVMRTLFKALETVRKVRAVGGMSELTGRAADGVSGNLLASLARMAPSGGGGAIELGVSWARGHERPAGVVERVRLSVDALTGLHELSEAMRGQARLHGVEVAGYVTRLDRDALASDGPGDVVIVPTEGEAREVTRVSLTLDAASYAEAIEAHRDGSTVRVFGTLEKKGRRWVLSDPRDFAKRGGDDG